MIKVEEIEIKDFRGIRELTLKLDQGNFAICGPNGTGKSGVVDALEFALTGSISRLTGEGTGAISVKDHGPHVNYKNNPERAMVTVKVFIPSLNVSATIQRTIKGAKTPKITPDRDDVKEVLRKVSEHPEFALSRREIIKYVITEPGQRAKDVQTLLRLDELEKVRFGLNKLSNAASKAVDPLRSAKERAETELCAALGIAKPTMEEILGSTNTLRAKLSLSALTSLEPTTSLKDGLVTKDEAPVNALVKTVALSEIKHSEEVSARLVNAGLQTQFTQLTTDLAEVAQGGQLKVFKDDFYLTALALFDEEICPVCDTSWEPAEFRGLMAQKIEQGKALVAKRAQIDSTVRSIGLLVEEFTGSLRQVYAIGKKLPMAIDCVNIAQYGREAVAALEQIKKLLPLDQTLSAVQVFREIPVAVYDEVALVRAAIEALPEADEHENAKNSLLIADERLGVLRRQLGLLRAKQKEAQIAADVLGVYNEEVNGALEKIYNDVQVLFVELYKDINDDEVGFRAELTPSNGKLGFDVDFYGKGYFPPGAYHSEGHQDGMGLCLYLALMKHLLGKNFSFAVLDDVMMSVDADHRRAVSKMLKAKFPETQFVLTTHDPVWLKLMKTAGLINGRSSVHFRKWDVENGPADWDDKDVWAEIEDDLGSGKVADAAGKLRRYLEHVCFEICDSLSASVPFNADGKYHLGELLPAAISAMSRNLKLAKVSAQSWGRTAEFDKCVSVADKFDAALKSTNPEAWQINAAIHFNEWANMTVKDFRPVVEAYKTLLTCFHCDTCSGFYHVLPKPGQAEAFKCECGVTHFNLVEKPREKKSA